MKGKLYSLRSCLTRVLPGVACPLECESESRVIFKFLEANYSCVYSEGPVPPVRSAEKNALRELKPKQLRPWTLRAICRECNSDRSSTTAPRMQMEKMCHLTRVHALDEMKYAGHDYRPLHGDR